MDIGNRSMIDIDYCRLISIISLSINYVWRTKAERIWPNTNPLGLKADTQDGFCSRSMLQAHFARVSTHEGAFSSSLNLPREFAPKYLTG